MFDKYQYMKNNNYMPQATQIHTHTTKMFIPER